MLIDALLMLDRYEAAIPHLKKLTTAQPDNPRAWYGLGRAYENESQRAFEALEKLGMDSPWWLALAAEVRAKEGKNTAAFTLYRAVLEKLPGFRGAHLGLAGIYRKTNHPDWAATEEEREKKLGALACTTPSAACYYAKANYERALVVARAARTQEALYWQSRAANRLAADAFAHLAKLPPSLELRQFAGELYRNQGRYADSIKEWQEAIRLSPDDPQLVQELVTTIYLSRDYATAERTVRELLAKDPNAADLQFILGDSLMNQQRPEEAIEPLNKAVSLRGEYPSAHAVLGRALLQLDRANEAIPHLKAALPADADGSIYFQLSRAYQSTGQQALADEARQTYQKIRQASATGDVAISAPDKK
jgi:predicted Zn-dependent protease